MSKHTEGPQWYARRMVSGNWHIADEASGKTIAHTDEDAHARLIAAAPELLQQLKRLVYFHRTNDTPNTDPWEDARAAIAKAEGSDR